METELAGLPEDVLADVLRRLPARSLATAACVCKVWHTIVDARALLLPYRRLLPHSVHGIFINYIGHRRPHLFARPSSSSTIPKIGFMPNDSRDSWSVLDHCNGLLLREYEWESGLCVCNPATRRWQVLPRHDEERLYYYAGAYLVFDPAVFEVLLIPDVPKPSPTDHQKVDEERRALLRQQEMDTPFCLDWLFSSPSVEFPPSPWRLNVFSSRTGRWEGRAFVREGEPAGTIKDIWGEKFYRTVNEVDDAEYHYGEFQILGFHPYKEVVFLDQWLRVVAYHLSSSKVQYLGNSRPKSYYHNHTNGMYESFLYTPCMIGDPLHGDSTSQSSSKD
ncbi:uncharacterized protein LOC133923758 [Phragmites australis]|uniref:uncharacterized protein LOC133923758 n=1 Tax=Phragmites australis TaxID=29695 RepID=UPI002D76B093|nr:uncharacterized protein LOC133923758 [Phragmites australis]